MLLKLVFGFALFASRGMLDVAEATSIAGGVRLYGVNYSLRQGPDGEADEVRCKSLAQAEQELQQLKADITVPITFAFFRRLIATRLVC